MLKNVLVTGGLGYIGSHACVELISAGYNPIILDNLSNCKEDVFSRLKTLTQKDDIIFIKGDVANIQTLNNIFKKYSPISVMHFAGSKIVSESVDKPLEYYQNNLVSTLNLIECMQSNDVSNIIFSSSANIYGPDNLSPMTENMQTGNVTNPYGRSKYIIEEILRDVQHANKNWSVILLRYFNPVGADASGLIGEDPNGIPTNLIPYIAKVANGDLPILNIFGNDYPTKDGTGIRDYIHVSDLARGHVAALENKRETPGTHIYNLGTGQGSSVLEMVDAYKKASGKDIPYNFLARREGDLAESYADVTKAKNELKWTAKKNIHDMVMDSWRWIMRKPD